MKQRSFLFCYFILIQFFSFGVIAGEHLDIVCTTTHLSAIVIVLGGDNVTVTTLIPYGMCPGHYELTPGQVSDLYQADIILAHGYEYFLKKINQKTGIKINQIDISENALLPAVHLKTAEKTAEILIHYKPGMQKTIRQNLKIYSKKIITAETEIKALFPCFENVSILCADMNRTFLEWLGFHIVGSFPRDEDLSLGSMSAVIMKTKRNKTQMVVDNLQSSGAVGTTLASELQIPYIIISNFPQNNNYIDTLQHNCKSIFNALGCH